MTDMLSFRQCDRRDIGENISADCALKCYNAGMKLSKGNEPEAARDDIEASKMSQNSY